MKTEAEIRDKIEKYGDVAKKLYDCDFKEAIASINMLKWVLDEVNDAT